MLPCREDTSIDGDLGTVNSKRALAVTIPSILKDQDAPCPIRSWRDASQPLNERAWGRIFSLPALF